MATSKKFVSCSREELRPQQRSEVQAFLQGVVLGVFIGMAFLAVVFAIFEGMAT